jgi:phosphatidylethanolamine/phosphatidyl-N-methylethanolamine N-methyltransferase
MGLKPFDDVEIPDTLEFLAQWVRRPAAVGAILPSGKSLAHAMAKQIDVERPGLVLELGGGTGTITKACIEIGVDPAQIVVLEKAPAFCALIRQRFPEVTVIRGDARYLKRLLRTRELGPFKAVLSGLPLLSIPEAQRNAILSQSFDVLAQDGVFVQFTYGPLSPVPRVITRSLALQKDRSAWVLRNVPPASVWRYSRAQPNLAAKPSPIIAAPPLPGEAAAHGHAAEPAQGAD